MPRQRIRVALVAVDFWEYTVALGNALADTADVHLYLPEPALERHAGELVDGVTAVAFPKPRLRDGVGQLRMCHELVRRLDELAPDVVHVQGVHLWFSFAEAFTRRHPTVLTPHDLIVHPGDRNSARTPQWVRNRAIQRADHVIVHAESHVDQLVSSGLADRSAVYVVPHLELERPVDRVDADALGAEHTLLFFGRIWPYKGLDYLIRAEPLIAAAVPSVRTVIAGEGEDLDRYRDMMVDASRFEIHNEFVSSELRSRLFRNASVVVLPYLEASMSGVVPIAYAFGKPVVATSVGGLPEIVRHGKTGLLVPPRDEQALARAAIRLLSDGDLRERLGEGGQQMLSSELSAEAVAAQTIEVYDRVLGAEAGAA